MSFVSWVSKISFFQTYTSANFKFSVPYKINLLGFTKSPNLNLSIILFSPDTALHAVAFQPLHHYCLCNLLLPINIIFMLFIKGLCA